MVTIKVKNIEGKTVLPAEGSEVAAGYDIVAIDDPIIVGETVTKEGEFFPFYRRIDYIEYHTALFISPVDETQYAHHNPETYHTLLHPRSSVRKYNLVLANSIGLIDNDYRGEIICCFKYIWQPEDYIVEIEHIDGGASRLTTNLLGKINRDKIYKKGDKIAQLVAEKTNRMEFRLVSDLDDTLRGAGGFGSTDKPKVIFKENGQEPNIVTSVQPEIKKISREGQSSIHKEEHNSSYGLIVDQYNKAGGISVKKKYSEEIKEREAGNQ